MKYPARLVSSAESLRKRKGWKNEIVSPGGTEAGQGKMPEAGQSEGRQRGFILGDVYLCGEGSM